MLPVIFLLFQFLKKSYLDLSSINVVGGALCICDGVYVLFFYHKICNMIFRKLKRPIVNTIFLLSLSTFVLPVRSQAQEALQLHKIIKGAYPAPYRKPEQSVKPSFFEANSSGGKVEATVKFKNGANFCTSSFRFEWWFPVPLDQLTKNQTVNITYKVTRLGSVCPAAKGRMAVAASMGYSPEFKQEGIRYAGGIEIKPVNWAVAGDNAAFQTAVTTLKVLNTNATEAVLKINFETQGYAGSDMLHFEVVYIYKKGAAPSAQCDPDMNAHNLYSLGVGMGMAEYAALMNAKTSAVVDYLNVAIDHAKASKCAPFEKLENIRKKLLTATSSNQYYNEIAALRNELAVYVGLHCNCCR